MGAFFVSYEIAISFDNSRTVSHTLSQSPVYALYRIIEWRGYTLSGVNLKIEYKAKIGHLRCELLLGICQYAENLDRSY